MKPTHMIRVLLTDGRVQRHYVKRGSPVSFDDYMYFHGHGADPWKGWDIDGGFYSKDSVIGVRVEPFRGIIADINGYEVICNSAEDLPLAIRSRQVACGQEIKALEAYLKGLGNVHPIAKHAGVSGDSRDARPEGVDSSDEG